MHNSRQTNNDYSITQFNMVSNGGCTPYTESPSKRYTRPYSVVANEFTMANYMVCPPSVLIGEENIHNDESPHKCHSIKTYAISTFFNNNCT